MKKNLSLLLIILVTFVLAACSPIETIMEGIDSNIDTIEGNIEENSEENISEDGYYTDKDDVSLYIHTFDKLPNNYISKKEAMELGWQSSQGNLWDVTEKKSIGGDRFGNREGKLPIKEGRQYYECDINYEGGYRGSERIVYSNDGLIYYTKDHYENFVLLYGDE